MSFVALVTRNLNEPLPSTSLHTIEPSAGPADEVSVVPAEDDAKESVVVSTVETVTPFTALPAASDAVKLKAAEVVAFFFC